MPVSSGSITAASAAFDVIIPEKMQKPVDEKMAHMRLELALHGPGVTHCRLVTDGNVAQKLRLGHEFQARSPGKNSTSVALSIPRHCAFKARISASSVSRIATSPAALILAAAAAKRTGAKRFKIAQRPVPARIGVAQVDPETVSQRQAHDFLPPDAGGGPRRPSASRS